MSESREHASSGFELIRAGIALIPVDHPQRIDGSWVYRLREIAEYAAREWGEDSMEATELRRFADTINSLLPEDEQLDDDV